MGYFYMNGKQYEILGEINRQQRNKPTDLKAIYIRSNNGDMIQLDNLIELEDGIAPPKLYRLDGRNSIRLLSPMCIMQLPKVMRQRI